MTELNALKVADKVFMDIPAEVIQSWKNNINSVEPYDRYKEIIKIYEQGFIDAIKYIKENKECQKNLLKAKKN